MNTMENKKIAKVPVNKKRFFEALFTRKTNLKALGDNENISRTESSIRKYLDSEEMPQDILDQIAKFLNVHPDYLTGSFDEKANLIEDDVLCRRYLKNIKPDNYPYSHVGVKDTDYSSYFENILAEIHNTKNAIQSYSDDWKIPQDFLKRITRFFDHKHNLMDYISMDQLKTLDPIEQVAFQQELNFAIVKLVTKYFFVRKWEADSN